MRRAVAALVLASAHPALGDPTIESPGVAGARGDAERGGVSIDLARCTAFDATALRHAIDRAVSATAARASSFAVIVDCPNLVTAHVHVEPGSAEGPIARSLDLGEIAGELRVKLLALAVAEVIEVAAAVPREPAIEPPRDAPHPRTFGDPRDPTPLADAEPREPAPPPAPPAPKRIAIADVDIAAEIPTASPPRRWTLEPRVAARSFTSTSTMLAGAGVELGLPWLRIGANGAIGQVTDPLGTLRPWLVTASIAREVACAGRTTTLCGLVRLEAGVAGVSATAPTTVSAHSLVAHYAEAGIAAELAHHFTHWSGVADFELAWADGLIARAGGREAAALAGVTMIGAIGVRWR